MHVGVVGCGTAGPAAAIFLARAGHRVTILERATTLHPVGAGILIQPTGMLVLSRLGVLERLLALGDRVERLHGVNAGGRTVLDLRYRDLRDDLFGLGLHRGVLLGALLHAMQAEDIDIHCGVHAIAIESIGSRPLVRDARKALHGPFDLLIVADGARSMLRPASLHARVRTYPYGALWFVAQDAASNFAGTLSQVYRGTACMVGFLPTGRLERDGPRAVSMFWSQRMGDLEAVQERGLERWKSDVRAVAPHAEAILDQIEQPRDLIPAVYHDVVLRRPFDVLHGPVVYLGDSAHAMSPQLGQGANLALVDAMTLADCVDGFSNVREALHEYAGRRRRNVRYYQFASRWLTPVFQSGSEFLGPLRDRLMGPMCGWGWSRRQMLDALAGVKTGLMPWSRAAAPIMKPVPSAPAPNGQAPPGPSSASSELA
ncbi:MAG: FAD-dependent oxidoreductase [Phycisphaerales bacterium]